MKTAYVTLVAVLLVGIGLVGVGLAMPDKTVTVLSGDDAKAAAKVYQARESACEAVKFLQTNLDRAKASLKTAREAEDALTAQLARARNMTETKHRIRVNTVKEEGVVVEVVEMVSGD